MPKPDLAERICEEKYMNTLREALWTEGERLVFPYCSVLDSHLLA